MHRLFVYGSLRTGTGHPMAGVLAAAGCCEGPATVCGRLYALDGYPGVVLEPAGAHPVTGELWRIDDLGVFARLDAYEGCGADDLQPFEFERVRTEVRSAGGERHEAWVYTYAGDVDETRRVPSGDWLRRAVP